MKKSMEEIFTDIYHHNQATLAGSPSGPGSDLENTRVLQEQLPRLFNKLGVTSLLDIPCGDFNWMRFVDLQGVDYVGADIVEALVLDNQDRYTREGISFIQLDLLEEELPRVDLVLCRDCLVHFSFMDGLRALRNISQSGSKYAMITHFIEREVNIDIPTGSWRPLNLEIAPFILPEPLEILSEGYAGNEGQYQDKSLAVWKVQAIRDRFAGLPG
jgi:SAM-dependent methyltransferase